MTWDVRTVLKVDFDYDLVKPYKDIRAAEELEPMLVTFPFKFYLYFVSTPRCSCDWTSSLKPCLWKAVNSFLVADRFSPWIVG